MIFIFNWEMEFGIIGTHLYFPRTFVSMDSLARLNNTPIEKLKIGLGQLNMSFTYPMEDVNSLCMSAVHQLLSELGIAANSIGRLSVGTESAVDKSKGVKSYLMDLFPGNPSMEGVQVVNACYGGTEALFNCIDWLHSPAWDPLRPLRPGRRRRLRQRPRPLHRGRRSSLHSPRPKPQNTVPLPQSHLHAECLRLLQTRPHF